MATSRQQRNVDKKKAVRLTRQQKAQQKAITDRQKAFDEKAKSLQKEQEELNAMRRKMVMENVTSFGLNKDELDAFVSALDGFTPKQDLLIAIINAATSAGKVDMNQFNTKLVRLGFA